jgi:hypothetical protein
MRDEDNELQDRLQRIVAAPRAGSPKPLLHQKERAFSAYVDTDLDAADALAKRMSAAIAESSDAAAGVREALDIAERELAAESIGGTVQYALKLLLTHDPTARRFLSLGSLEQRQPNAVRPTAAPANENEEE